VEGGDGGKRGASSSSQKLGEKGESSIWAEEEGKKKGGKEKIVNSKRKKKKSNSIKKKEKGKEGVFSKGKDQPAEEGGGRKRGGSGPFTSLPRRGGEGGRKDNRYPKRGGGNRYDFSYRFSLWGTGKAGRKNLIPKGGKGIAEKRRGDPF